jgi:hypothetical protein
MKYARFMEKPRQIKNEPKSCPPAIVRHHPEARVVSRDRGDRGDRGDHQPARS